MPKVIRSEELDQIVEVIGRLPDGAELDEILAGMGEPLSRRTLQRRLADLVIQGRITGGRAQKSFKYRLVPVTGTLDVTLPGIQVEAQGEVYVPTSAEGEEIKVYVRQPIQGRRPVGYNIEFLEAYRPNATWYLPGKLREQLHIMGRSPADQAPAGTFARDILNRLLIDLSWASSRLEGNTYNRLDTERLIRFGEAAEGKDAIETQMILNHKAAIEYLVHDAERVAVNADTVIALHAFLSDGLLADPMACGKLRNRAVEIGGSVYLPMALPQRIEELFGIVVGMAAEIGDPFEQAFFLMVHLPYLQPFEDVNKRVSRLAANIPLIKGNLSPLSFIDVPERAYVDALLGVHELNRIDLLRDVFLWAYERSCQQYVAVKSQLVPPDIFRLRYRAALAEAVSAIVRGSQPATIEAVHQAMPTSVVPDDQEAFARLVLEEFKTMHAGNAVRFGLRPLEFESWLAKDAGE
ncbi:MAG: Fic family protein [Sterolibacteriaceae bacterium]|nr:Fic family protein [Sterolibacteriaceae bacterium]